MNVEHFISYAKRLLGKYFVRWDIEGWNGNKYIVIEVRKEIPEKVGDEIYRKLMQVKPRGFEFAMVVEDTS